MANIKVLAYINFNTNWNSNKCKGNNDGGNVCLEI